MSGRIIPLRDGGCAETQDLMPWLVSGGLTPVEEARARAHLDVCPSCQGEYELEQRLRQAVATLPAETDVAWRNFQSKLESRRARRSPRTWVGWAIAAQVLLLIGGAAIVRAPRPATFHVLGASSAPRSANILVMFRPATTEAGIRTALRAAGARMVDGPTEADAYLLSAPPAERKQALAALTRDADVTLAQPLDPGEAR